MNHRGAGLGAGPFAFYTEGSTCSLQNAGVRRGCPPGLLATPPGRARPGPGSWSTRDKRDAAQGWDLLCPLSFHLFLPPAFMQLANTGWTEMVALVLWGLHRRWWSLAPGVYVESGGGTGGTVVEKFSRLSAGGAGSRCLGLCYKMIPTFCVLETFQS